MACTLKLPVRIDSFEKIRRNRYYLNYYISIFTGLNNFEINSIVDIAHDEQFRFTDGEVRMPDSESYAYKLVIPNKEVREVLVLQIQEWFKAVVAKDDDTMKLLSRAILDKDEKQIARQLNIVMSRMISILDTRLLMI